MQLKNFSMIESASGWALAPAYDLLNVTIVLPDDPEELALTLQGKKRKIKKEHFQQLGKDLGLTEKQVEGTFTRLEKNKTQALEWIGKSFLSDSMKLNYVEVLEKRYKQLDLS